MGSRELTKVGSIGRACALTVSLAALLAGGCGTSSRTSASSPARGLSGGRSSAHASLSLMGVNRLVSASDAAVIATVDEISPARWNSADGKPWVLTSDAKVNVEPVQYRDVTVTVSRVLYSSAGLPAKPSDTLVVRFWGSGSKGGASVDDGASGGFSYDEISGPVHAGRQVLFVLKRGRFGLQDGYVPVIRLVNDFQSNWELDGSGGASNLQAGRSVTRVDDLINRLVAERAAGPRELSVDEEAKTEVDPLG